MKNIKKLIIPILLVLLCLCIVPKTLQNDTYFSIAVGRQILKTGVDMKEHLVWHSNLSYTYTHWLFDLIMLLIYNVGGFKLIYVFTIVFTCVISFTLYYVIKKICKSFGIAFIVTLGVVVFSTYFFSARAQIISYLLFIVEVYSLEQLRKEIKKRYIFVLIIIPIMLANVHASVWFMYFGFYLPYFAEILIGKFKKNKKDGKVYVQRHNNPKLLIFLFLIGLICGLLSPLGSTPYVFAFKTISGLSKTFISELRYATYLDGNLTSFLLVFVLLLIAKNTKINYADLFMILGLSIMSMYTVRCIAYLLLIGSIPLSKLISQYFNKYGNNSYDKLIIRFSKNKKILSICLVFYVFLMGYLYYLINYNTQLVDNTYPINASEYILENIDTSSMKVYNDFGNGSYLEFMNIPAFIDSRSEIYTQEYNDTSILGDYLNLINGVESYEVIFDKYEITHVLLKKEDFINTYIFVDNDYELLYEDEYYLFYKRV